MHPQGSACPPLEEDFPSEVASVSSPQPQRQRSPGYLDETASTASRSRPVRSAETPPPAGRMKRSVSMGSVQTAPKCAKISEVRFARFELAGFPGPKTAVFVPDGLTLTTAVLEQICQLLDREVPSLLLSGVSSLAHPTKLSTPQLRKCRGFAPLMEEVRGSLNLPPPEPDSATREPGKTESRKLLEQLADTADRVLEKKVASALGNLSQAALRSNAWVLAGPRLSNFEVILQQLAESGEQQCFRAVYAHAQDRAYMECAAAKALMKELFEASQVVAGEALEDLPLLLLPGDLWDPAVNQEHAEFKEHGWDFWSFDAHEQRAAAKHPVTLFPWPHAELFLLFYKEEEMRAGEADWDYATAAPLDMAAVPFRPDALAPSGQVFLGDPYCWQPQMKRKVLQSVRLAQPVVLLDNTPNVAKQLSALVKLLRLAFTRQSVPEPLLGCLQEKVKDRASPAELLAAVSAAKALRYVETEFESSGMNGDERLALSDVVGLLEFARRRPQAFKETVCAVDPLTEGAEATISQLIAVFTSQHASMRDKGSVELHQSLALKAWALHLKLERRASMLSWLSGAMDLVAAVLMLASTTMAMFRVHLSLLEHKVVHIAQLDVALIVAPVLLLLLLAVQASFQVDQTGSNVHMAASRVASETQRFLGGLAPYDSKGSPASQRAFLRKLRQLTRRLDDAGVSEADLTVGGQDFDMEQMSEEVQRSLYGAQPTWQRLRRLRSSLRCVSVFNGVPEGPSQKELAQPWTAESYMELRVAPLQRCYQARVRRLGRARLLLHCGLMTLLSLAVGLGYTDYSVWIPVALASASFVAFLMRWLAPFELSLALNGALTTLHKLDLRWRGTDLRERRSEMVRHRLIAATEELTLGVERAASSANAVPELAEEGEEEEEAAGEKPQEESVIPARELRTRAISVAATPRTAGSGVVSPTSTGVFNKKRERLAGT